MAYSNDLRIKVVEAYKNKEGSMRKLASRFSVSLTFVRELLSLWKKTGSVQKRPHGGGTPLKLTSIVLDYIRVLLLQKNDRTEVEIQQLLEHHHIFISTTTVGKGIRKLGWSRKKKRFMTPEKKRNESKRNDKSFVKK